MLRVMKTSEYSQRTPSLVADLLYEAGCRPACPMSFTLTAKTLQRCLSDSFTTRMSTFSTLQARSASQKFLLPLAARTQASDHGARRPRAPPPPWASTLAPTTILKDMNLDVVANHLLMAVYLHTGYICRLITNIVAHKLIASELTAKVKAQFRQDKSVADRSQSSRICSFFAPISGERVQGLYDDTTANEVEVAVGTPGFDGALVQSFRLTCVKADVDIMNNKTFGPLHSLVEFDDPQEVVKLVNSNPQAALSASVHGQNKSDCRLVAREMSSGAVHGSPANNCLPLLLLSSPFY
ncbi:ALDH-like protein [Tilletiaria anomala UBC 951]|uniref:ALDH-like protein n=1 Tax=Tilletiaria anomala (strain ATCC 24038 / CBS 436.72 / UBC 951) TaxID=1037660 RepID=A0A066VEG4_TILAU|nr:ALDH-like protein [Tilletiaria anomala UBC 951]KDN37154.1 ALDH-like protein [Tilletiaria anomala UBC 951]